MATVRSQATVIGPLEQELRELRQAFEDAPEAICRIDLQWRFVRVNRAHAEMLGHAAEKLIGQSWEETIDPRDRGSLRSEVAAARAARTGIDREVRAIRLDGTVFPMRIVMAPIPRRGGRLQGHYLYSWDLSQRKTMEDQLIFAGRMAAVGMLAAGVAHEINNPLAYIVANIDFSRRELAAMGRASHPVGGDERAARSLDEVEEALEEARQGTDRVRNIVRDLKLFARSDDEAQGPVTLRRILESSINIAWNEIRHRARLVKDFGETPPVDANESRLGQVFLNLLLNAAQAIPEGAAEKNEIRVCTRTDQRGRSVVEVRDSGEGIPAEILSRIFDPFFTTKPSGVGTGLGLWICQGILAPLGGTLEVESEVGRGSLFRVTLPVFDPAPARERGAARGAEAELRGARILVVDDEPLILGALRRALDAEYQVTCCKDGREALQRLRAGERFDVILSDLMMPELSGMELHAEIGRLTPDLTERMIFVTGGAFTPKAREFLERIPNARVEKPVDFQNLRILIRNMLR
jgi:PAS domain S-box-containing protein